MITGFATSEHSFLSAVIVYEEYKLNEKHSQLSCKKISRLLNCPVRSHAEALHAGHELRRLGQPLTQAMLLPGLPDLHQHLAKFWAQTVLRL
jgi:hypothetical protein